MKKSSLQIREKFPSKFDKTRTSKFILQLYDILTDNDHPEILSWSADGYTLQILSIPKLQDILLPKVFKHNKASSFIRQLNYYGFHKLKNKKNVQEYKHMFFRRDKKHLLNNIKRNSAVHNEEADSQFNDCFKIEQEWQKVAQLVKSDLENHNLKAVTEETNFIKNDIADVNMNDNLLIQDVFKFYCGNEITDLLNSYMLYHDFEKTKDSHHKKNLSDQVEKLTEEYIANIHNVFSKDECILSAENVSVMQDLESSKSITLDKRSSIVTENSDCNWSQKDSNDSSFDAKTYLKLPINPKRSKMCNMNYDEMDLN